MTAGVEDFDYRGGLHHVVPGAVALVDAETVHTGQPGVIGGWRYEVLYADADLVRDVSGGVRPSFPNPLAHDPLAAALLRRAHLTQCRVDRARTLLSAGGDVATTPLAVGFADQAHLTRHFRRHVGVPPARFARERRIVQESR